MGKINSRDKGKRGELELAHYLTDRGYPARRGQQFKGSPDSPDIECEALKGMVHIECKRVERLQLYEALKQANSDKGEGEIGVVFHRKNKEEWCAILSADSFLAILDRIIDKEI